MLTHRSITNQFDEEGGTNTLSLICREAVRHPGTGYPLPWKHEQNFRGFYSVFGEILPFPRSNWIIDSHWQH